MSDVSYILDIPAVADLRPSSSIVVSSGVKNADYRVVSSLSGSSSTNMEFQLATSSGHLVGSQIHINVPVRLSVTAAAVGAGKSHPMMSKNRWAWSRFAVYQAIERISVSFNGQSYERKGSDFMSYIAPFLDASAANPTVTSLMGCPDNVVDFNSLFAGTPAAAPAAGLGPFGELATGSYSHYLPRHTVNEQTAGAAAIADGNSGVATVTANLPLYLPFDFFDIGNSEKPGLANISNMVVSVSFNGKWERMLSIVPFTGVTVTSVTCNALSAAPQLYYQSYLPHDFVTSGIAGSTQIYEHTAYNNTPETHDRAVGFTEWTSSSRQLGSVPQKILVCAAIDRNAGTANEIVSRPDFYAVPDRMTVSFGGQNVFASMDTFSLWKLAVKNGLKTPWEIAQTVGFPVLIDLRSGDLGTFNQDLFVGSLSNVSLQVQMRYKYPAVGTYRHDLVTLEAAFLTTSAGAASSSQAISVSDSAKQQLLTLDGDARRYQPRVLGAGIGSFLKGVGNSIIGAVPKIVQNLPAILSTVKMLRGGASFAPTVIAGSTDGSTVGGCNKKIAPRKGSGIDDRKSQII